MWFTFISMVLFGCWSFWFQQLGHHRFCLHFIVVAVTTRLWALQAAHFHCSQNTRPGFLHMPFPPLLPQSMHLYTHLTHSKKTRLNVASHIFQVLLYPFSLAGLAMTHTFCPSKHTYLTSSSGVPHFENGLFLSINMPFLVFFVVFQRLLYPPLWRHPIFQPTSPDSGPPPPAILKTPTNRIPSDI